MLSRIILESFKELAYSQVPKFSSVLHHCVVMSKYLNSRPCLDYKDAYFFSLGEAFVSDHHNRCIFRRYTHHIGTYLSGGSILQFSETWFLQTWRYSGNGWTTGGQCCCVTHDPGLGPCPLFFSVPA